MEAVDWPELVVLAQGGDRLAFDGLVRRFQDRAVAYARTLLNDPAAAEDAGQEAFVQAWRDLPALKEPVAFPAWLRRIVFKFCDRVRRRERLTFVSLDAAGYIAGGSEPERLAESAADTALIRLAFDTLPETAREAAFLYYLGGCDLAEIAVFLGVPRTTVKNRLHAARGRLRKELCDMAEAILEKERPSRNGEFAAAVMKRLMTEFWRQMKENPHTADQSLPAQARTRLDEILSQLPRVPLDWETVRAGHDVLRRQDDRKAMCYLLMRYLGQPLEDSHRAWAYLHLATWLAHGGDPVGSILAQEAFEQWLPGRHVRISAHWPYDPVAPDAANTDVIDTELELTLLTFTKAGEPVMAWFEVGREEECLTKADQALARAQGVPLRDDGIRYACMRMLYWLCERSRRFEKAWEYVRQMYEFADIPTKEVDRRYWRVKVMNHDVSLRFASGDTEGARKKAAELSTLLADTAAGVGLPEDTDRTWAMPWIRGERHDLAFTLLEHGEAAQALSLLETNAATGAHANSWGWMMHSAASWQVEHDRARALALIREAAVRDNRDLMPLFQKLSSFQDVWEDPEFGAAVRKPE